MFRPSSYLMNISRVSEDGLFHSLLSVSSRAIHHTGWNIIKRKLFWTRLHSYPLCGVWCENPTEGFNILTKFDMKVSLEVFIKTAVEFLVLVPVHSKIKMIPILRCHWCTHRLLVQCIPAISDWAGCCGWVILFYKESNNFQRQNNQICAATITEQALRTRSCVLRIFYKEHKQLAKHLAKQ